MYASHELQESSFRWIASDKERNATEVMLAKPSYAKPKDQSLVVISQVVASMSIKGLLRVVQIILTQLVYSTQSYASRNQSQLSVRRLSGCAVRPDETQWQHCSVSTKRSATGSRCATREQFIKTFSHLRILLHRAILEEL